MVESAIERGGVYAFRIASTPSGLRRNEAKSSGRIGDSPLSKEDTDMVERTDKQLNKKTNRLLAKKRTKRAEKQLVENKLGTSGR